MYKVLLISINDWDSLMEIPVMLKNGGCSVDVFCIQGSWALNNKSYDNWIPASDSPETFVDELIDFTERNGNKYDWIIPGDDIIIRLLNKRIVNEELFYKILPISKIENRELLGSKAGFSTLCTKYSIKTPRYLIYNETMTPKSIGDYMKYPFLMKVDESEAGYGIFLCENETSLIDNLAKVANKQNLVFQQFIQGYDVVVEVLYKNGKLMVYNYSRMFKLVRKYGVCTQRVFYQKRGIEAELIKIGQEFGLNGFCNIAFMYSEPEKSYYLIEVDVRPTAWMYYGKFTGNNFSEAIQKVIEGDLTFVEPDRKFEQKEIKIRHYKKDIYRCFTEKDIKGFLAWLINKDHCWRYIPFYDRKLLSASNRYLFNSFRELVANKFRKK